MKTLEDALAHLLHDLCRKYGFCLRAAEARNIETLGFLTDETFATEVLRAEGFVPEYEVKWMRILSAEFRKRFGRSEVRASDFEK